MGNRGISTVIASILMLMIVVGLGGTAYLFISGTFTGKTATTFEVIDEVNGTVTIRNSGTETITGITATLDGNVENIAVVPNIDGLIGYWSFNDGSGIIATDSSVNKWHGSIVDNEGDQWTIGRFGEGLQFDGVNDYVSISDSADFEFGSGDFTINFWFNSKNAASGQRILTKGFDNSNKDPWHFYLGGNEIHLYMSSNGGNWDVHDGVIVSDKIFNNIWYNIALTRNGSTFRFFVDGSQVNSFTSSLSLVDNSQPILLGKWGSEAANFNGIIDEVVIYKKALTESEIKSRVSGLI